MIAEELVCDFCDARFPLDAEAFLEGGVSIVAEEEIDHAEAWKGEAPRVQPVEGMTLDDFTPDQIAEMKTGMGLTTEQLAALLKTGSAEAGGVCLCPDCRNAGDAVSVTPAD